MNNNPSEPNKHGQAGHEPGRNRFVPPTQMGVLSPNVSEAIIRQSRPILPPPRIDGPASVRLDRSGLGGAGGVDCGTDGGASGAYRGDLASAGSHGRDVVYAGAGRASGVSAGAVADGDVVRGVRSADRVAGAGGGSRNFGTRGRGAGGSSYGGDRSASTRGRGAGGSSHGGDRSASTRGRGAGGSSVEFGRSVRDAVDDRKYKKLASYDIVRTRPRDMVTKTGVSGTKTKVQVNYFKVLAKPNWTIYQYRVDFSPDIDNTQQRCHYLAEHRDQLGGYIFDGTLLFCSKKFDPTGPDPNVLDFESISSSNEIISIRIKYTTTVETADSQQFQVLNLILRRAMQGLNMQIISRNFYDPKAMMEVKGFHLEVWPGYLTSIRQHETDILMCAEVVHRVMRTDTLYNILVKCSRSESDAQTTFKQKVIGTIVMTDYNNKTYRVDDVDFKLTPKSTFPTKEGDITYVDYYQRRYNKIIHDLNQPLLVSRPTERNLRGGKDQLIMLIPEFARATGLTDEMRSNFRLMKALSEHTRLTPENRIKRLSTFNERLQTSKASTDVLNLWNLKLDTKLVEVPARVLPKQTIIFGNGGRFSCGDNADWTVQFRTNAMFKQIDIKRWIIITPQRAMPEVENFVRICISIAMDMRMHIAKPKFEVIPNELKTTFSHKIDECAAKDPQLIMFVLTSQNEERYNCIKKRLCVDRPLPSQVVTLKTITPIKDRMNSLKSIATKVVIQMNAKLKGIPWMVEMPLSGLMTVGFDVCHSSKDKNKSFGALVAATDLKQANGSFFSSVSEHLKGQELSHQMSAHMLSALKVYTGQHGSLPERILFFRDGVGDGQLLQVVETEVKVLKDQLDEIYFKKGHNGGCRLAFIVVAKRIHTRYFLNTQNPVPGTVVDDVVTLPERYDFFLVSQSVRQGTVSPTSYNVIHDSMHLGADKLQLLSYKMTHMYFNFSGTCRVPAVCQYAHKLAFLTAENIHRKPSSQLDSQLYFL